MKKGFLITLINNFSLLFTLIGVIVVIYSSCFYFPDYLVAKEKEKVNLVGNQLIEELSSRLLEGESIDVTSVHEMIEAKEINTGIAYPYSISSLLVQTREWIISNDFISKEQKSVARNSIKKLISEAEQTTSFDSGNNKEEEWLEELMRSKQLQIYSSMVGGILISLLGLYSIYYQYHLNKRVYLRALFEENKSDLERQIRVNLNFETVVANALKSLKMKYNAFVDKKQMADLSMVSESGKTIYIKSRYWEGSTQPDPDFIENFIQLVLSNKGSGILITNSNQAKENSLLDEHNKNKPGNKIYLIVGDTLEEIKAMLMNSINRIDKGK